MTLDTYEREVIEIDIQRDGLTLWNYERYAKAIL